MKFLFVLLFDKAIQKFIKTNNKIFLFLKNKIVKIKK